MGIDVIKPQPLQIGDTIAIIAPSGGLAALAPHRLERGKQFFEHLGFQVRIFPTALSHHGLSSDSAEHRAKDIMDAFEDPSIKAIVTTIGGYTSHETLSHLNFESVQKNPKIFCGYSDITSLHIACFKKAGLIGFYGPAILPQFGEFPTPDEYTVQHFLNAVTGELGQVIPSNSWSDDKTADWLKQEDMAYSRVFQANPGYEWFRSGKARGHILGGCLPVLLNLINTEFWPDIEDYILFLETPEGDDFRKGMNLDDVYQALEQLRDAGLFDGINALVFGRGFGYSPQEHERLKELVLQHTKDYTFPILWNFDIGHTDPMVTIPIGVLVELNSEDNTFRFLEQGVQDSTR